MPTFDLSDTGVENCRQCKGCGVWTRCKYGWCYGCYGDMRTVDGILWELANAAERVARIAELATIAEMGGTPDLFQPPLEADEPWERWSELLEKRIAELRAQTKRFLGSP